MLFFLLSYGSVSFDIKMSREGPMGFVLDSINVTSFKIVRSPV